MAESHSLVLAREPARVAVVAVGIVSPLGFGLDETQESLRVGRDCVTPVTRFSVEQTRCKTAGQIPYDRLTSRRRNPRRARRWHRVAHMMSWAWEGARANARQWAVTSLSGGRGGGGGRVGLVVGRGFNFQGQGVERYVSQRTGATSDCIVSAEGRLTDGWARESRLQYRLESHDVERLNVGARYTPSLGRALNAPYRYTRELVDPLGGVQQIKQVDISG